MPQSQATETGTRRRGRPSRRAFLGALAAGTAATAGCLGDDGDGDDGNTTVGDGDDGDSFEGETIRVAPWSGPYAEFFEETVAASFEEETGAEVEVVPEWGEIVAKVRAAPEDQPPYDVMAASDYELYHAAADDLLMEIDVDNLSNLDELYPFMRGEWREQYRSYGPPVDGTPYSFVYDVDAVDFQPEEWDDLLRDEVTDAGIDGSFWIDPAGLGAILVDELPGVEELEHEEYHEDVFDMIRRLRDDHLATFTQGGADFWEHLRQGVITMGQAYYGSALGTVEEEESFELTLPTETQGYFDNYVRVRGTDGKDEIIEAFLDHIIDAEVQQSWHEAGMNMMANENVDYAAPADEDYPTTDEDYEQFLQSFIQIDPIEEHVDTISETVRQIVAGE